MKFNLKVIGNIIGILLLINGLLMLTAVPFGIYHGEGSWKGILVASLVNSVIGFILYYNTRNTSTCVTRHYCIDTREVCVILSHTCRIRDIPWAI